MTQRMNFFQEGTKGLTYRRMAQGSIALFLVFLAIYGTQKIRLRLAVAEAARLEAEVLALKKSLGLEKGSSGPGLDPVEVVHSQLVNEPAWAEVLRTVDASLLEGVWLKNVQWESQKDSGQMTLEGTAFQARLIPGFIDRLRSQEVFTRVHLLSSETNAKDPAAPLAFKIQAVPKGR